MNETTASIIRAVLKVGGGFLVARGLTNDTTIVEVSGALVTLIGFVWGMIAASKAKNDAATVAIIAPKA